MIIYKTRTSPWLLPLLPDLGRCWGDLPEGRWARMNAVPSFSRLTPDGGQVRSAPAYARPGGGARRSCCAELGLTLK